MAKKIKFIPDSKFKDSERFVVPEGCAKIDDKAFADWKNLRSVRLPEGVTSIGNNAFEPDWLSTVILSVFVGLLVVFGPDAAQRKKNRQKLVEKFKK